MKTLCLALLFPALSFAAPHPATSSSAFTAPENGLYFLHKGFTLKTDGSQWKPVADTSTTVLDTVRFAAKEDATGYLTVRTDKVAKSASLELYTRRWMRDYPNYGFEILATKNFSLNGQPALIVDLASRSKGKQIRQVVLKNEDKVAIMTCMDNKESFGQSVQQCNQIIKTFRWASEPAQAPALKK
ncbi:hypothetical protein [Bdellovibrio sp. NC01]|uniref:hypothetical protein n=1 Tax=Bdellovibrio sp. NC01 TaxID=2220073 RepID=UPI00115B8166|nr:hypothetical protein [Bdellovibrio sp. NC01]QDK39146.1 hypothetical protein DOE51_16900 [Bdellovibrio sp. NC01]